METATNRFSFSLTTFNPEGKLKQVEYANLCGARGAPSVGICTTEGIVLATEKKIDSNLAIGCTVTKLEEVGTNSVMTYSGMSPDFRILAKLTQKKTAVFDLTNGCPMGVDRVALALSHVLQEFTQSCGVRPFGLTLLIAGWDVERPRLYRMDAGGSYLAYKACAVGQRADERMAFLESHFKPELTLDAAIVLAIRAIKLESILAMPARHFEIATIKKDLSQLLDNDTVDVYLKKLN